MEKIIRIHGIIIALLSKTSVILIIVEIFTKSLPFIIDYNGEFETVKRKKLKELSNMLKGAKYSSLHVSMRPVWKSPKENDTI